MLVNPYRAACVYIVVVGCNRPATWVIINFVFLPIGAILRYRICLSINFYRRLVMVLHKWGVNMSNTWKETEGRRQADGKEPTAEAIHLL